MATTESSASIARPSTTLAEKTRCFRHEGEECPRCDGSGYRKRRRCARCGEVAGSVSEGTGCPLVRDRYGDGRLYHLRCLPGTRELDVVWSGLDRMNS
jgi:hypothetical protein